jgi:hypothetical protein
MVMQNISVQNNKNLIYTDNGQTYKKNTGKTVAGVIAAGTTASVITHSQKKFLNQQIIKDLKKDVPLFDNSALLSQVKEAFQKSKLKDFGVKIMETTPENEARISAAIEKSLPEWVSKLPKQIKDGLYANLQSEAQTIMKGGNACYIPKAQTIVVNSEKMGWASFHEMGHALNKNCSKIGKVLRKMRTPGLILSSIAMAVAIFKRKKVEGEQTKGTVDKATTFIKNHATGLAALGTVPLLAEEGLASIKGAKLAKGIISPENYKVLNKLHGKAWLTYAAIAGGTILATYVAGKVRDAIAKPKQVA